jgi:hypothetical protein
MHEAFRPRPVKFKKKAIARQHAQGINHPPRIELRDFCSSELPGRSRHGAPDLENGKTRIRRSSVS